MSEKSSMKRRTNAIVDYLEYQMPVTKLNGQKGNGDMQAAKRDWNVPMCLISEKAAESKSEIPILYFW